MWANTSCPFSSSTRNMALGNGSVIVPSISMTSFFFDIQLLFVLVLPRQYLWPTVFCDRNRMLEMRRQASIRRHNRPPVVQLANLITALRDHRLDRQRHAGAQRQSLAGRPIVLDLRVLVQRAAHTMTDILAHHTIAVLFGITLDRVRYIAQP